MERLFKGGPIRESASIVILWVASLTRWMFQVSSSAERISEDDTQRLLEIRRKISAEKDLEVAQKLRDEAERYEKRLAATRRISLWSPEGELDVSWPEVIAVTRERLMFESERLEARSRSNLRNGILTGLLGIVVLVFVLFIFPPEYEVNNMNSLIASYAPRLFLVLIVQVMATFFLRMYVSNESDIKLNKNELTNVEQRLVAALMVEENEERLAEIAMFLSKDERNFVLKKGERVLSDISENDLSAFGKIVEQIKSMTTSK